MSVGVSISTKLCSVEHVAGRLVHPAAQAQGGRRAGAAQVEVAVLEACLLADLAPSVAGLVDREGQRRRGIEHLDVDGHDLDLTRREIGVLGAVLAGDDLAGDLEAVLAAQAVRDLLVADDDLDHPAGLAQVKEGHSPVIAATSDPSGEGHGLADVLGAQGAGVMGADHFSVSLMRTCGRRSWVGGVQVAGSASTWSPLRMSLTWWVPSGVANHTNGMPRRSA